MTNQDAVGHALLAYARRHLPPGYDKGFVVGVDVGMRLALGNPALAQRVIDAVAARAGVSAQMFAVIEPELRAALEEALS